MISQITPNRLKNNTAQKFIFTPSLLQKKSAKTQQIFYYGDVPCWMRASAAGSPDPALTYSSLGCFLL